MISRWTKLPKSNCWYLFTSGSMSVFTSMAAPDCNSQLRLPEPEQCSCTREPRVARRRLLPSGPCVRVPGGVASSCSLAVRVEGVCGRGGGNEVGIHGLRAIRIAYLHNSITELKLTV